jgi:cadmium resistance protein CadD (predicted permease)
MEYLFATSLIAAFLFVATNTDHFLLLLGLFSDGRLNRTQIVFGQLIGLTSLFLIGLLGRELSYLINAKLIDLLGLVPIAIGVNRLFDVKADPSDSVWKSKYALPKYDWSKSFILTIANGGDNIAAYTPIFAQSDDSQIIVFAFIFIMLDVLWCVLSAILVGYVKTQKIAAYGNILGSMLLIILGLKILIRPVLF